MRFKDFFIEYEIERKRIKQNIPFNKLPLYRKIILTMLFLMLSITAISFALRIYIVSMISVILAVVLIIIFIILDSTNKNLENMLENHYKPYSKQRMDSIKNLILKYKIDITNIDKIDLLILEATEQQKEFDYFLPFKKPAKTLYLMTIPIITFFASKFNLEYTKNELINIAIIILVLCVGVYISVWFVTYFIKEICFIQYRKYDELISDLKQIKIFYS
ncbi:MAG: hypothetical protein ACK5LY_10645 [Lachnospirales bacterium]